MTRFQFCLPILLVLFFAQAMAQERNAIRSASLNYSRGFVLAFNQPVAHLNFKRSTGVQLDIAPEFLLGKAWRNAYPEINLGMTCLVNSNSEDRILGTTVGLGFYAETHIIRRPKHKFLFRAALGPAWSSSPFDLEENPRNVAIGSRITAMLQGHFTYSTPLLPKLWLRSGVGLTHFSNGSFQFPNYGLNIPGFSLGLMYYFVPPSTTTKQVPDTIPKWKKEWQGYLVGQLGIAENFPTSGPKYISTTGGAYVAYRAGLKSALTSGIEYMYNSSLISYAATVPGWEDKDITRWAATIGHDLYLSHFNVHTQIGIYVYKPLPEHGFFYQRISTSYSFFDRYRAGLSLKLHGFSAETLEFQLATRVF